MEIHCFFGPFLGRVKILGGLKKCRSRLSPFVRTVKFNVLFHTYLFTDGGAVKEGSDCFSRILIPLSSFFPLTNTSQKGIPPF